MTVGPYVHLTNRRSLRKGHMNCILQEEKMLVFHSGTKGCIDGNIIIKTFFLFIASQNTGNLLSDDEAEWNPGSSESKAKDKKIQNMDLRAAVCLWNRFDAILWDVWVSLTALF